MQISSSLTVDSDLSSYLKCSRSGSQSLSFPDPAPDPSIKKQKKRKTLNFPVLLLLNNLLSLKTGVNVHVPTVSNMHNNYFCGHLEATEEKDRIRFRIRIKTSRIRNTMHYFSGAADLVCNMFLLRRVSSSSLCSPLVKLYILKT